MRMHHPALLGVLVSLTGCLEIERGEGSIGDPIYVPNTSPFRFEASTVLTNFGNGTNHFPADFTTTPGFYMNDTGSDLVIGRVQIQLEGQPYGLGAADVDICLAIIPPVNGAHGTRTGVEQFCIAQHKSASALEWPEPSIDLDLPGQGLLLEPGHHVVCTAQGAVAGPVGARTLFSTFACALELSFADVSSAALPVQSIRAPYFDERFRSEVSSFSPHVNPTQATRKIVGMMSYVAVASSQAVVCIDTRFAGDPWGRSCTDVDLSGTEHADTSIRTLDFRFGPDDQISSHCQIANPAGSFLNICASYFFVSVPRSGDRFAPLAINDTIPAGGASGFCNHLYADQYLFTDPEIEGNRDRCTLFLGGVP